MIKLLLTRFWPVFLPVMLYIAWLLLHRHKANKAGQPIPDWRDGPWLWVVASSLVLAILGFLSLGVMQGSHTGGYTPPHVENGTIVPGSVE